MNYNEYHISDFLNDDSFIEWVLNQKQSIFWDDFALKYQAKEDIFREAQKLVLELYDFELEEIPENTKQKKIWTEIISEINDTQQKKNRIPINKTSLTTVCTLVLICVVLFIGWYKHQASIITYDKLLVKASSISLIEEVSNSSFDNKIIYLEDGSKVILKQHSKIGYPIKFKQNTREVFLSGEAYFEVKKMPEKPFLVYAKGSITKVLGTSFTIKAYENSSNISVDVHSGKVTVLRRENLTTIPSDNQGIILLPNQRGIIDLKGETFTKELLKEPQFIPLYKKQFTKEFEEVSAIEIFKWIEKNYGIIIIYDEELVKECILTITLGSEPLYEQLHLICETIGANYQEVDAQIVIKSQGCH